LVGGFRRDCEDPLTASSRSADYIPRFVPPGFPDGSRVFFWKRAFPLFERTYRAALLQSVLFEVRDLAASSMGRVLFLFGVPRYI